MAASGLVDWQLAARVGGVVAHGAPDDAWASDPQRALATCGRGLERVLAYTGLEPATPVPAVELVDRATWMRANLDALKELVEPLERQASEGLSLPWPVEGIAQGAIGAAAGVEAGVAVGYAARRVLGQYHVSLGKDPSSPRMFLLGSNLTEAARDLGADRERFLLWVAIHEQTHSVQFAAVPWLRDHMAALLERVVAGTSKGINLSELVGLARRLVSRDPRRALREALRGELARLLAGPEQAGLLDQIQATMAVIEGYAEHVMDAAAADDPDLASMRASLDERRARRGGLGEVIARALGLGMKLRQYELGKSWSDAVATRGGIDSLNRVWGSPAFLPTLEELEQPEEWLTRIDATESSPRPT